MCSSVLDVGAKRLRNEIATLIPIILILVHRISGDGLIVSSSRDVYHPLDLFLSHSDIRVKNIDDDIVLLSMVVKNGGRENVMLRVLVIC